MYTFFDDMKSKNGFTNEDKILVKFWDWMRVIVLKMNWFPEKQWSRSAVDRLQQKSDATGSAEMKYGSGRKRMHLYLRLIELCVHFQHRNDIIVNLTFLHYKLLFLISVFNYLYFRNRAANFAEIYSIYANQIAINVAIKVINSEKLSRSYDSLYIFRRHFFGTGYVSITLCNKNSAVSRCC